MKTTCIVFMATALWAASTITAKAAINLTPVPSGDESQVNTFGAPNPINSKENSAVAALPDGGFMVTWRISKTNALFKPHADARHPMRSAVWRVLRTRRKALGARRWAAPGA